MELKKYYTVTELADLLGFSKSYIYKLVFLKKLNPKKPFGKTLYFEKESIEKLFT